MLGHFNTVSLIPYNFCLWKGQDHTAPCQFIMYYSGYVILVHFSFLKHENAHTMIFTFVL